MPSDEYVSELEHRLTSLLRHNDALRAEADLWQQKYEGVQGRIEALEATSASAEMARANIGRTLKVEVTLQEDLILRSKDSKQFVGMVIADVFKRLSHELEATLFNGELKGMRVPMFRKVNWATLFSEES